MKKSTKVAPKKRGRPPTRGHDIRLPKEMIEAVDSYSAAEQVNRSEAVRRLVELGLLANTKNRSAWTIKEVKLAFSVGALKEILEMTLVEAVKSKGSDGVRWLDEYESELIGSAKRNTHSQGLSYEDEANVISSLINLLKLIFAIARRDITKTGKNH